MNKFFVLKELAIVALISGFAGSALGQLVGIQASSGAAMEYKISSPGEDINLDVTGFESLNGLGGSAWELGANNIAARTWALQVGGNTSADNGSFSATAQAGAQAQVFGDESHYRYGYATGAGSASLTLSFGSPTIFEIRGQTFGSGSATTGGSGNGGGIVQIFLHGMNGIIQGQASGIAGSTHVVGLGFSAEFELQAGANASGANANNIAQDSLGAGAGRASVSGGYDTNVIDPYSLGVVNLTTVPGECVANVAYPALHYYTQAPTNIHNIDGIIFDPSEGSQVAPTKDRLVTCKIYYKIGFVQTNYSSMNVTPAVKCWGGPLFRFASGSLTTVFFPSYATPKVCGLTNVVFNPPSGSAFPVGTNHVSVAWQSSYGNSGTCMFDVVIDPGGNSGVLRNLFPDDSDGDGVPDWQELLASTDRFDPMSVLKLLSPVISGTNVTLSWPTVSGIRYQLESGGLAGAALVPVGGVITGGESSGTTNVVISFSVASSTNQFYRVKVVTD